MFYPIKPFLQILSICALFLLPMHKAASDGQSGVDKHMPINLVEASEKIAALALEQQKTSRIISTLQIGLNAAFQELNELKVMHNNLAGINAVVRRTANGHGR